MNINFCFLFILLIPVSGHPQETPQEQSNNQCPSAGFYSDITYQDLRSKLENTLKEKNKSLIFLDFKGLQAQMDILSSHLLDENSITSEQATTLLEKSIQHLDQLNELLNKAKAAAQVLKESHVVPLATLTSLKSEADACTGSPSQFTEIFKTLSQLNKDLNEILMLSQNKIYAQKLKIQTLLKQINRNQKDSTVTTQSISENFNFIQRHINSIIKTFEFDTRVLNIASAHIQ